MDCTGSKRILRGMLWIILMLIVALPWGFSFGSEIPAKDNNDNHLSGKKAINNQAVTEKDHKIIVFYFHKNIRCYTCNRIEQLTKEAVEERFGDEIKKGLREVKVLNVEEPTNNHYIKDYRLYTKSVIVSDMTEGKEQRWKNLQRVWELTCKDAAFKEYVQKEVREYLEGKQS